MVEDKVVQMVPLEVGCRRVPITKSIQKPKYTTQLTQAVNMLHETPRPEGTLLKIITL